MKPCLFVAALCVASAQAQTFRDDSLAVRGIVDANHVIDSTAVYYFRDVEGGRITGLLLNGPDFVSLPPEIGKLTSLRRLSMHGCRITVLPAILATLPLLDTLDITDSPLSSLPDWMGSMTGLRLLRLVQNELTTLPASVAALPTLQLEVSGNHLCDLPGSTAALLDREGREPGWKRTQDCPLFPADSLEALALLKNNGLEIPWLKRFSTRMDTVAMRRAIYGVYIYGAALDSFALPGHIPLVRRLTNISIEWSGLRSLPWDFKALSALVSLELPGTRLAALPDSFFSMPALHYLELSDNHLTALPSGIASSRVSTLRLARNRLQSLPPEIVSLNLPEKCPPYYQEGHMGPWVWSKCLYLTGNNLCDLPADVAAWADRHAVGWKKEQECPITSVLPVASRMDLLKVAVTPSGLSIAWLGEGPAAEISVYAPDGTLWRRGRAAPRLGWDSIAPGSGVYVVVARAGNVTATRRIILP